MPVASLNGSLDGSLDEDRIEPGVGPRPFVVTNPTSERCFSFRWSPDAGHVHCLVLREFYVHEICSTCTLDGYFSVLESPGVLKSCGGLTGVVVRVLRYFAFLARLRSLSVVDIIPDAVLPSSASSTLSLSDTPPMARRCFSYQFH